MMNSSNCIKILGFWKFSKNRLVGTQSCQATHTRGCVILGSFEELPSGMTWATKRR